MTIDEFQRDLSDRLGRRVERLLTRDGAGPRHERSLSTFPAGFAGRLECRDGSRMSWELWLEDGDTWNFHAAPLEA